VSPDAIDTLIDEFIARSRLLTGKAICERPHWNTLVTADSIRHFAYGTSDDNPLWLDETYATKTRFRRLVAPPAFLCSVLYPLLNGEAMEVPLSNLIGEVGFEWFQNILDGDRLRATARQLDVSEAMDRKGGRLVYIMAETTYWNQRDEVVAKALGTMVRAARKDNSFLIDRTIYQYSANELQAIREAIELETRTGDREMACDSIRVEEALPLLVRGPLTIGDLVCWEAAIGPSYRAAALGYRDTLKTPHTTTINPVTGWPVKYSQQHEDFLLASQRGMPAPFDNGLMRFAWIAPMLTNWMGDEGFLKKMTVQIVAPVIYGDTTWYRGTVTKKRETADGTAVTVKITGVNQLGQMNTTGEAEVLLLSHRVQNKAVSRNLPEAQDISSQCGLSEKCVLELFETQVEQRPGAPAVICDDQAATYREIDARANQLARHLHSRGIGPDVLVGILLERSVESVVSVLAVLKAGAAFLPLDADQPDKRLLLIMHSTGPAMLLTETHLLTKLTGIIRQGTLNPDDVQQPQVSGSPLVICIDSVREAVCNESNGKPSRSVRPHHLAYVMPTSGTLSAPKNVAVTHSSLSLYIRAIEGPLSIKAEDVCLHTASFSFSASVRQLFLPLCQGATLVIANPEQRHDALALFHLMKRQRVTIWDTVPAIWQYCIDDLMSLREAARSELLDNDLRLILSTGEALSWEIPFAWRTRLQHSAMMMNLYSQTETTGTVSVYPIPNEIKETKGYVPLGLPVACTRVVLLDEQLMPVRTGEIGEIFVGGARLALGYLDRADLTAERFITSPFSGELGGRLYRTGDLGRCLSDGSLEFVGRSDHRVKIMGQWIELEEIEEALKEHRGVREAVAVVREDVPGDSHLIAYVVNREGYKPDSSELQTFLRGILPGASVPCTFVFVHGLPLTPAGKVDRKALPPPPGRERQAVHVPFTASRSPVEDAVVKILAQALDFDIVGVEDNFFDLGGNSLTAMRVVSHLRQAFSVQLSVRSFFENPTAADIAAVIDELLMHEIEGLSEEQAQRLLTDEESH
jgi:amino acid adenylation domain-containing protein